MLYALTIASFIVAIACYILVSRFLREERRFIGGMCLFILIISYQTFHDGLAKLQVIKQHAEGE